MYLRNYKTYEDYINDQKSFIRTKAKVLNLSHKKTRKKIKFFISLFSCLKDKMKENSRVLCLGARKGEEIMAFNKMGHSAIGVDLIPLMPFVVQADFHSLPFENECFDVIYSNSIDHVYDINKFVLEVDRVLVPGGFILFHLQLKKDGRQVCLRLDSSLELTEVFGPRYEILEDYPVEVFSGGLNYILLMKKLS
jgi:SAM-dependent methyltransferase